MGSKSPILTLLLSALLIVFYFYPSVEGSCASVRFCSGHGKCRGDETCDCQDGWGSSNDVSLYKSPDCSSRVCPSGIAWADLPMNGLAHRLSECSNQGVCNRKTGKCECYSNFAGEACQRSKCPNGCSGHGVCKSMRRLAREYSTNKTDYENSLGYLGFSNKLRIDDLAWDADSIYGCVCDSSWPVGPYPYQTNVPEWFGPDCSKRHCPSADNPYTQENELDCWNVTTPFTRMPGSTNNRCHVDCSNLGICDFNTGVCSCFPGQYGDACNYSDGLEPNIIQPPPPEYADDDYVPWDQPS